MAAKAGAVMALLGLLGAYLALRENPAAPASQPIERPVVVAPAPTVEPPMPSVPVQPAPEAEAVSAPERKPGQRRRIREPRHLEPPATEGSAQAVGTGDPAAELALLVRARRVLLADPARTIELTDEHVHDYPHGAFAEEREVLAIEALLRMGNEDRARGRIQRFKSAFPNSTHTARIQALLE